LLRVANGMVIAGKYRLEHRVARGGMGSVWTARHLQLDHTVAIKFMDPVYAASSEARDRFEREAKASAQLQSPHVVQIHDYGVEDETPYIVMELLRGEDLGTRLKREKRLSLGAAAVILTQVAKALRRTHDAGIVHRDLKPTNVFLAQHDEDEVVKVLDFGVAKAIGIGLATETTKTGSLVGSPHFMSPEQVRRSKEVDHRSDLWSVAVIVFRMITGRLPFTGEELGDVLMKICSDPIPTPSSVSPDLDPAVDRFFERAFARNPTERFQTAREMADAFSDVAARVSTSHALAASSSGLSAPPAAGGPPSGPHTPLGGGTVSPTPSFSGASAAVSSASIANETGVGTSSRPGHIAISSTLSPDLGAYVRKPRPRALVLAAAIGGTAGLVGLAVFAATRVSSQRDAPTLAAVSAPASAIPDTPSAPVPAPPADPAPIEVTAATSAAVAPSVSTRAVAVAAARKPTPDTPSASAAAGAPPTKTGTAAPPAKSGKKNAVLGF
jgi:eukaryotic-like serine/threonine-protein kinase